MSLGERYTGVKYAPDPIGDLIFNGVAGTIDRSNRADTLQADFSTPIFGGSHTLRYGFYGSNERPVSNNTRWCFPADADGNQTGDTPIVIVDNAPHITRENLWRVRAGRMEPHRQADDELRPARRQGRCVRA